MFVTLITIGYVWGDKTSPRPNTLTDITHGAVGTPDAGREEGEREVDHTALVEGVVC